MYNLSLLPSLTRLSVDRPNQISLYHAALAHVFAAGLPAAMGGALLAGPVVHLVFGPAYAASAVAFGLLVWSIPLNLLRDVPLMALLSAGQERVVLRVTLIAAILSVGLSAVLVPEFGLVGAGLATLAAETVRMGVALAYARGQGFPLPRLGRFGRPAAAGLAMGSLLYLLAPGSAWVGVPLGMIAYGVVLTLSGGLRWRWGQWPELDL